MSNFEPGFSVTSAWKKKFSCPLPSDFETGNHFS
jgi:hypothetical protein